MSDLRSLRQDLKRALAGRTFVRLERSKLEDGYMDGKIVALSSKIAALALVGEDVRPNGLTFLRVSDITKVANPAPYARFLTRALRARGLLLARPPRGPMSSWADVIKFAASRYPLLTLHTEESDAEVCYVGKPKQVKASRCVLAGIGPDARWDTAEPLAIALQEVTRIDCGGAYEEALALVAGSDIL
jgi:hypothetical protein